MLRQGPIVQRGQIKAEVPQVRSIVKVLDVLFEMQLQDLSFIRGQKTVDVSQVWLIVKVVDALVVMLRQGHSVLEFDVQLRRFRRNQPFRS